MCEKERARREGGGAGDSGFGSRIHSFNHDDDDDEKRFYSRN